MKNTYVIIAAIVVIVIIIGGVFAYISYSGSSNTNAYTNANTYAYSNTYTNPNTHRPKQLQRPHQPQQLRRLQAQLPLHLRLPLQHPSPTTLTVATTTSLYDTGLEDTTRSFNQWNCNKRRHKRFFPSSIPMDNRQLHCSRNWRCHYGCRVRLSRHAIGPFSITGTAILNRRIWCRPQNRSLQLLRHSWTSK